MTDVVLNFSMSLDGFVAGPDVAPDRPMGQGGEALHTWPFQGDPAIDGEQAAAMFARVGAVVLGRETFEVGLPHWEGDTPYPAPSFVVTHRPGPPMSMKTAAFTFVTEGVEAAVTQARDAAGGKDVVVMGADVARQCLAAGLATELRLQIVPILLGGGLRLFEGGPPRDLEIIAATPSASVTHLAYRL